MLDLIINPHVCSTQGQCQIRPPTLQEKVKPWATLRVLPNKPPFPGNIATLFLFI